MTTVRTVAAHQIVADRFPKPPREEDALAIASGAAVDHAVSQFAYGTRLGRRPSLEGTANEGMRRFDEVLAENPGAADEAGRAEVRRQVEGTLRAYRKSPLVGLPRPPSRIVLIGTRFGYYAQPDFWDGRSRFFEMKSYAAAPTKPDLKLQLSLFQLAFPGLEAILVCFDRRSDPVPMTLASLPSPSPEDERALLGLASEVIGRLGEEKVLEYVRAPAVHYSMP